MSADNPWDFDENGAPHNYRMFVLRYLPHLFDLNGVKVGPADRSAQDDATPDLWSRIQATVSVDALFADVRTGTAVLAIAAGQRYVG